MKSIILAAGYGTRLRPLTDTTAKPLLPVAGRPLMEYCLSQIETIPEIDAIFVVTNSKYIRQFRDWLARYGGGGRVRLIDDGSTENENRLGALRDIQLVIEVESINDDILITAGDNIFGFHIRDFVDFFREKRTPVISVHEIDDTEKLRKTGVVCLDGNARVIEFEEKPARPKSNLAVPPLYIYPRSTLHLLAEYLAGDNNPDAPGNFIAWLHKRTSIHAFRFSEERYAIDDVTSYKRVELLFSCLKRSGTDYF